MLQRKPNAIEAQINKILDPLLSTGAHFTEDSKVELSKWSTEQDDLIWGMYTSERDVMPLDVARQQFEELQYRNELRLLKLRNAQIQDYLDKLAALARAKREAVIAREVPVQPVGDSKGEAKAADVSNAQLLEQFKTLTQLNSRLCYYIYYIERADNIPFHDRADALRCYHRLIMSTGEDRAVRAQAFETASAKIYAIGGGEILWNAGKILAGVTLVALGFGAVYAGFSMLNSILGTPASHTPASVGGISEAIDAVAGLLALAGSAFGFGVAFAGLFGIAKGAQLAWEGGSFFYNACEAKKAPAIYSKVAGDANESMQAVVRPKV